MLPEFPSTPTVSVVIPTRGRRHFLEQMLHSLSAQTLTHWEAVIVDDGSPDDTADYLATHAAADPRLRPMSRAGPVGGANVARNQGLAASRGTYVVFLDSDDLLEPDSLALRVQRLEANPRLDFTVHAMRCFAEVPGDIDRAWITLTDEDDFDRFLLMDGPWQTAAATWRRASLACVGSWDPNLLSLQDLDFHLRALAAGLRYEKVNGWDCHYRLPRAGNSISSEKGSLAHCRSHARIAKQLLDLPDAVLSATPIRRDRVGGFCFLIATRCAEKGDIATALTLWRHGRRRSIVSRRRFAEGVLILLSQKHATASALTRRLLFNRWPPAWRAELRQTFLNAPVPPRSIGAVGDESVVR